ncbi:hypothetical protein CPB84DRAFT_1844194 [Gymnopilus junonius]|uniref:Uncharacterized protein n=1 Tax=Gymnopilus junonius TaxID=109634 RepID=A0A9P5NWY3_GYMJU|nr:hypothetical protein CPB84DRAFT_1844194 [Gymnopilus junonius]
MPEGKENKRHSKIPAGIAATSNRLETTKAVINALKNVGNLEQLLFLKEASSNALTILAIIQGIEDGDLDDDFVALGLDSLGLVYIVINQCEEESKRDGSVFDQMKINSGELSRTLQSIAGFVEKKANRKLIKRIIKQSADEEKVDNYRQQLKIWMSKFGQSTETSIHDVLQEVIDEKLRRLEQREKKPKEFIAQTFLEAGRPLTPVRYPPPVIVTPSPSLPPAPPKLPDEKPLKLLPTLNALPNTKNPPSRTGTPEPQPQQQNLRSVLSASVTRNEDEKERQRIEAEAKRKKRLEDERVKKLAERERWRKSEQDFIQLPQASPIDEVHSTNASTAYTALALFQRQPGNLEKTINRPSSHARSKSQIEEDERLAAALHADFQRQFAEEDEEVAVSVAVIEQRKWEAEEREKRTGRSPKRGKAKPKPRDRSPRKNPSFEIGYGGLPPEDLEGLRLEERYGVSEKSPKPDPKGNQFNHSSSSLQNELIPSPYYHVLPNMHPGYTPPSMSNVSHSGISLGGGPVQVINQNSGNVHTVTITNSGNDYSVNRYSGSNLN